MSEAPDNDQILELIEQAFMAGIHAGRRHERNHYSSAADSAECSVTKTYARALLYRHWPNNEASPGDKTARFMAEMRPIMEAAAR